MLPGPALSDVTPAHDASSYTMFHLVESVQFGACVRARVCVLKSGYNVNAWIGCGPGQCEVTTSCNRVGEKRNEALYQISHRYLQSFKGPILYQFSDPCFSSRSPAERPRLINYAENSIHLQKTAHLALCLQQGLASC